MSRAYVVLKQRETAIGRYAPRVDAVFLNKKEAKEYCNKKHTASIHNIYWMESHKLVTNS